MTIFDILKKNPVFLAPMAGITDLAFREIIRENGGYMAFTEMVSAKALYYKDNKTLTLLKTNERDVPLSVQLFGHEPDIMTYSAKKIEDMGFNMIDINCGCPAPKIYKNGDGSALLKNPHLIYKIVSQIRKETNVILSVKIRTGYDKDCVNAVECAKMIEDAGADFVTVHGRTRDMMYSGKSDLNEIKKVKEALSIPVIGNGDIKDYNSFLAMKETNCDGFMVGRHAQGNPFAIMEISDKDFIVTKNMLISAMISHMEKMCMYKGENAIREGRTHLLYYLGRIKGAKPIKKDAALASTMNDVLEIAKRLEDLL